MTDAVSPRPARNIIIDNVLAEGIFRQPKAVNMRSPHRHQAHYQRGADLELSIL
ncbi:TPA: hypothetical protein ACXE7Y_005775, partial [Klebsiella variicola]